ncbi:hypothetical protein [Williamsia phyllosphaerae]|uniref:Anti-sigma factor n=1 Tax=Williamsia phyllosphaerae TaxID=885042 RepID=A0ABQ1UAR1_9NOCA|nr:hypothetical protein [Williamsia phyllosphaerae]GGF14597.1 hypothetical protein GCM10007298_08330 [Williamsia phyllosphaerae]
MSQDDGRRGELIAGAVGDDLTAAENEELRALAADDPSVDLEIAELRAVVGRIGDHPSLPWVSAEPSPELRSRVVGGQHFGATEPAPTVTPSPRRRPRHPRLLLAAAVVLGLVVGAGTVLGITSAGSDSPVTGPPGTLGAYESIDFSDVASGLDIDGSLVAHTWGTETVLEMDGVPDRGRYGVFLVERSGARLTSGTFLGSTVTIDCRMNAAVLREDVTGVEIRRADGSVLATAQVPATG